MSKRVPHVKIETFKSNNSETDRPIQIKLTLVTHFSKLSKSLKFGVEIRKKKLWSFLNGFSSKKSKLSFYAKKYAFELKWPCWFQIFSPEVSTIKFSKVMTLLIIFCLKSYARLKTWQVFNLVVYELFFKFPYSLILILVLWLNFCIRRYAHVVFCSFLACLTPWANLKF